MSEPARPADLTRDDFAAIGEVIVHAAALENMLVVLASVLLWHKGGEDGQAPTVVRDEIRDRLLGESGGAALGVCRRLQDVLVSVASADFLHGLWDDCAGLIERRNAVAHSFWMRAPDGRIEATRALPKRKRANLAEYQTVGGTLDEMGGLRDQFADAISDIKQLLDQRWPGNWPEVAAFSLREPSPGSAKRLHKRSSG
ncbi:hypothetical protein [Kribbella sp. NPDC049584]|uniref:hypothetical protein n=1 Tax=Kribbella sp. NPDC049584 TaxID=3154833 RepID=UPI0034286283